MPYPSTPPHPTARPHSAWYATVQGQAAIVDRPTTLVLATTGPISDPASVTRAVELADILTVTSMPSFAGLVATYLDVPGRRWRVDLHTPGGGLTFFGETPASALHTAAEWLRDLGPPPGPLSQESRR